MASPTTVCLGNTSTLTATVTVNEVTSVCTGTPASGYTITTGSSLTASPASYTINSTNVTIAPNVSVTVASGATLIINGSWLHACIGCTSQM